jgi:hypothetical protein
MIDGIRRRFARAKRDDAWNAEKELEPKVEEASCFSKDTLVNLARTRSATDPSSNDIKMADYYKGLVRTAIANGGRYADHPISVPWLRMILAGLEMRQNEPKTMWAEVDSGSPGFGSLSEVPSYSDLFPSIRDTPSGLRPHLG